MADTAMESSQREGTPEAPTSEGSTSEGVQQSSQLDVEGLLKRVEQIVDQRLQSVKDKRIAKLERTVNDIAPVLERFKGIVPDDKLLAIQRDMEWEDMKRRVYGGEQTGEPQAGNHEDNAADLVTKAIDEALQLPANDSRVTDLKLKHKNDFKEYLSAALALRQKLGEAEESTPAEQPLPQGGTARKIDNPIADITDSRTLYRLAAEQMRRGVRKKS